MAMESAKEFHVYSLNIAGIGSGPKLLKLLEKIDLTKPFVCCVQELKSKDIFRKNRIIFESNNLQYCHSPSNDCCSGGMLSFWNMSDKVQIIANESYNQILFFPDQNLTLYNCYIMPRLTQNDIKPS